MTLYDFIRAAREVNVRDELDTRASLEQNHLLNQVDSRRLGTVLNLMRKLADKLDKLPPQLRTLPTRES